MAAWSNETGGVAWSHSTWKMRKNVAHIKRGFNMPSMVARKETCLQDGKCSGQLQRIDSLVKDSDDMSQLCSGNAGRLSQRTVVLVWFLVDCHHCQQKDKLSKM